MSAAGRYLGNIRDAVVSTARGMRITLRYWVREPAITVEYPDRLPAGVTMENLVAERWRGHLGFDPARCTACLQCMRICPIACIRVATERREQGRLLTAFDINIARCMYCGLCVEECPTGAVHFTRAFEGATPRLADLFVSHVRAPLPLARPARPTRTTEGPCP